MENEDSKTDLKLMEPGKINLAIRQACSTQLGVLDGKFLCQPISTLNPQEPIYVNQDDPVQSVIESLQAHKIGCVLVVDDKRKLTGIFSERDCILKVLSSGCNFSSTPISMFMTKDPFTITMDAPVAFALNLMSQGGFRHLPVVDDEGDPIGIISVKNVVDHMVAKFVDDVLSFPTE